MAVAQTNFQRMFSTKPQQPKKGAKKEEPSEKEESKIEKEETEETKETKSQSESQTDSTTETETETSSDEETDLTKEDVKKIKQLILDQDEELEKKGLTIDKLRNEYRYQLAENDNTVKRYKTELEKSKQYAISKFAMELLSIKDDLTMALKYTDLEKMREEESKEEVMKSLE